MFKEAQFGASFTKPSIAVLGNTLTPKAGINCAIALYGSADTPLFGNDDYDVDVAIATNQFWASFEFDMLLDLKAAIPVGSGGFGVTVEGSTNSTFYTYCEVADNQPAVTLQQALQEAFNAFSIPLSSKDVLAMQPGRVYTKDISGVVKVGGEWTLPLSVNQLSLASADLPFNSSLAVQPDLNFSIAGDIALKGEFNVRLRRSDAGHIRIGVYKVRTKALEASFTASAGLGASVGSTDLITTFFTALSPGIGMDKSVSDADLQKFQQVLNDSIDRSLSISVNDSFSGSNSTESAIVYELDITAADEAMKNAIDAVLGGDWTLLRKLAKDEPSKVKQVRNVLIETTERKARVTVNILGLYNYESIADFIKSMRVVKTADGSVVITDNATATQIAVASTPLAADPDRLRKALFESFTITAIYKVIASQLGLNSEFAATQELLLIKDSMSYADAFLFLKTGEVLGVLPSSVKTQLPNPAVAGAPKNVNHARFDASVQYSAGDVLKFFFADIDSLHPHTQAELEKIGRTVLATLLNSRDPTDKKRIAMLADDEAWAGLNAQGSNIPAPYYSDWYDIHYAWSRAVAQVGPLLKEAIAAGKQVNGDPTKDQTFMNKRKSVLNAFGSATRKTHAPFNPNFAICVMATLAGRTPGTPPPEFEASWNGKQIFSSVKHQIAASALAGGDVVSH